MSKLRDFISGRGTATRRRVSQTHLFLSRPAAPKAATRRHAT